MLARRLDFNVMPRGHAGTWDSVQEFQIYRCIFARITIRIVLIVSVCMVLGTCNCFKVC